MNFVAHTIAWSKGEILEAKIIMAFGIVALIAGIFALIIGTTPFSKAIVYPLLILGTIYIGGGAYGWWNNAKRIEQYPIDYAENPEQFVKDEKARFENIIQWYPKTLAIAAGIFILGGVCFLLWGGIWGRNIGLGLMVVAVSIFFVDHFSEERANGYYELIQSELSK